MNALLLLTIAFIVLQVLDVYTTRKVLSQGGRELNPIMSFLMEKLGTDKALYISKAFVVGVVLYFFNLNQLDQTLMIILDIIYLVVVVNNFRQMKK